MNKESPLNKLLMDKQTQSWVDRVRKQETVKHEKVISTLRTKLEGKNSDLMDIESIINGMESELDWIYSNIRHRSLKEAGTILEEDLEEFVPMIKYPKAYGRVLVAEKLLSIIGGELSNE